MRMSTTTVLMSIRPRFANLILSGSKTVELRRSFMRRACEGDRVLLYVSSPERRLLGWFEVKTIATDSPCRLWGQVKDRCGLTKKEFNEYYAATKKAVAIFLCNATYLNRPVSLAELRRKLSGFHPPQSFQYLSTPVVEAIGLTTEWR